MKLKRILRSSIKYCIPFYSWIHLVNITKTGEMDSSDFMFRLPQFFKNADLDNSVRGRLRLLPMFLVLAGIMVCNAFFCPGLPFVFLMLAYGTLPGIVGLLIKQTIRGISYLKNSKNPKIINPTYPSKYKPYENIWGEGDVQKQCVIESDTTRRIMQALYNEKQRIKDNAEGFWDLNQTEQQKCDILNLAIKFYRNHSYRNVYATSPTKFDIKQSTFHLTDRLSTANVSYINSVIEHITGEQSTRATI